MYESPTAYDSTGQFFHHLPAKAECPKCEFLGTIGVGLFTRQMPFGHLQSSKEGNVRTNSHKTVTR